MKKAAVKNKTMQLKKATQTCYNINRTKNMKKATWTCS